LDLNEHHLPEDAGEYAEGLSKIMDRIPDGWGRWISHGKGWYKIICETDEMLSYIDPDYEIHQVKEKFGTLRFYYQSNTYSYDSIQVKVMDALVGRAEQRSSMTCESCGAWQGMEDTVKLQTSRYYVRTLCSTCAIANGYTPTEDPED
jgi:hypothetical protein